MRSILRSRGLGRCDLADEGPWRTGYGFSYDHEGRLWMAVKDRFQLTAEGTIVPGSFGRMAASEYLYDGIGIARHAVRRYDPAGGSPTIQTPIDHNVLPSSQQWTNLDRRGNWREFGELFGSSPTGVTQARTVNAINQYTAISLNGQPVTPSLQHDAAGNLTLDPLAWNFWAGPSGLKYEYDEENRLTRVRIAANDTVLMEIGYDAVGRRVETVEYWDAQTGPLDLPRHTRHVYEGLQAVEEYECGTGVPACGSGWSLAREFVWGGRFPEPIAMVDHTAAGLLPANQPEVLHYLHDVLGSVIGLTNSAGTLVERYTYDPYGKTLVERRDPLTGSFELNGADGNFPTWSAFGNPFMWTAQRYDATVGLYHFKYRTYNPIWGRWHQQDPLGYVDGVNLYEYVASSPLIFVDIFGLETFREVWNSDEVQKVVKDVWDWAVKNNREVAIEIRVYKNGTRTIAVIPGRRDHVDPDHHWPNDPKGKPGDKKKPGYSKGSGHTHQRDEHEKGPSQQDREWHRKYRQPGVVVWKDKNGKLRQTFVDQDGNDDNDDKDKKGVDEDLKLPPKKGEWKVFDGRKEPDKKNTKC